MNHASELVLDPWCESAQRPGAFMENAPANYLPCGRKLG
jgi:hypothetical protein